MLRDVFLYIQQQTLLNMPTPGLSGVVPSLGATGTVALSGSPSGTFYGRLEILSSGALGVATARLSLNAANQLVPNYQATFVLPASGSYPIPLEQYGSPYLFTVPSGLTLTLSGTFTLGDSYTFTASVSPDFRVGEEYVDAQDRIFPSIVFVPTAENFVGTEDFAGTQNYLNAPTAKAMGENVLEAYCWGVDYERTELLKNQLIYGVRTGVPSPSKVLGGKWTVGNNSVNRAGREYVLSFSVKIPVLELDAQVLVPTTPTAVTITPQVTHP